MKLTTKQRVENLLKYMPDTRSNDKLLCVLFMQKSGVNLTDEQIERFFEMDDLWNVRRYRQKFQEQGLYKATEVVEEARYNKFKHVKQNINYESPEKLLESQGYKIKEWGEA